MSRLVTQSPVRTPLNPRRGAALLPWSTGDVYDPIAETYFSSVAALGGGFDSSAYDAAYDEKYIKGKINDCIVAIKALGVWTNIKELWLCGASWAGAARKIKYQADANLDLTGQVSRVYDPVGHDCGLRLWADHFTYNNSLAANTISTRPSLGATSFDWGSNNKIFLFADGWYSGQGSASTLFGNASNAPTMYCDSSGTSTKFAVNGFTGANFASVASRAVGAVCCNRASNTAFKGWINTTQVFNNTTTGSTAPTNGINYISSAAAVASACSQRILCIAQDLTELQATSLRDILITYRNALGALVTGQKRYVYEGDSLTWGYDLGVSTTTYSETLRNLWRDGSHVNVGDSGHTTGTVTSQYASQITPLKPDATYFTKGIAFLWIGTNDLGNLGSSAATVRTALRTIWTSLRTDGFKIVAFNIIPRDDINWSAGKEAERLTLNSNIAADSSYYDQLIDVASLFPNPADTNYFGTDKLHLNRNGYLTLANHIYANVNPSSI